MHPFDLLESAGGVRLGTLWRDSDAMLHLATVTPRDVSTPNAWVANTRSRTEGTRHVLDGALAVGTEKNIQQSISMAHPDGGDSWLDENTALDDSPERAAITAPVRVTEAMVRPIPPTQLNWCIPRGGLFARTGIAPTNLIARLRAGEATVPGDGENFFADSGSGYGSGGCGIAQRATSAGSTPSLPTPSATAIMQMRFPARSVCLYRRGITRVRARPRGGAVLAPHAST